MRHLNQDEPHGKFTLECIERHVDRQLLRAAEKSERELLTQWAAAYGGVRS